MLLTSLTVCDSPLWRFSVSWSVSCLPPPGLLGGRLFLLPECLSIAEGAVEADALIEALPLRATGLGKVVTLCRPVSSLEILRVTWADTKASNTPNLRFCYVQRFKVCWFSSLLLSTKKTQRGSILYPRAALLRTPLSLLNHSLQSPASPGLAGTLRSLLP